jgi:glucosyl-3-phosphoglycerate phosphatase
LFLFCVRHGESRSNADPEAVSLPEDEGDRLTERGSHQAKAAAAALREVGATRLLTSPMRRATETAAAFSEALGLEPEVDPDIHELRESAGFGSLPPEEQKLRRWSVWMAEHGDDSDYSFNGGESFNAVRARVRSFLGGMVESREPGPVIAVTHGIFLRFLLADVLWEDRFRAADVQRLWLLRTINGGISLFEHGERHHPADPDLPGWTCRTWMAPAAGFRGP